MCLSRFPTLKISGFQDRVGKGPFFFGGLEGRLPGGLFAFATIPGVSLKGSFLALSFAIDGTFTVLFKGKLNPVVIWTLFFPSG